MFILERIAAFFLSILIMLGVFGADISTKKQTEIKDMNLTDTDVTNGFTVSVSPIAGTLRFNRINFAYQTTAAVRAVFRYRLGRETLEEELLLSAKSQKASMLLDCYLSRKTASRLLSVHFEPIVAGQSCILSVSSFTCDLQSVPKEDVLYIENDHYKAGVNLQWGGGLS